MCEFKSGIAVKLNECEVEVYTLPLIDRHTLIREKHGIKENSGSLSDFSTPVELVPKRYPVKSFDPVDWKFVFDDRRPDWWTDSMTDQATSQLLNAARQDLENENEQEHLAAVKQDGYAIRFIKNPSEKIQIAAVKQNGIALCYIKKPSEEVQLAAVKQNGDAIEFIKNPSEAVKKVAKST